MSIGMKASTKDDSPSGMYGRMGREQSRKIELDRRRRRSRLTRKYKEFRWTYVTNLTCTCTPVQRFRYRHLSGLVGSSIMNASCIVWIASFMVRWARGPDADRTTSLAFETSAQTIRQINGIPS